MNEWLDNLNIQNNVGPVIFEILQAKNESRASLVRVTGGLSGTSHVLFEITFARVSLVTSTEAGVNQSRTGSDFHPV